MPFWPLRQARYSQDVRHKRMRSQETGRLPRLPRLPPFRPISPWSRRSKGPIMTALEEFYKIGPGPSSSHTMGPMRITYDFFQRVSKLPEDQLQRATALKVHLFGSLSATGKGHGTDRASLAGLLGKAPATCPPQFLDGLAANPDQTYKVTLGPKTLDLSLKDIIFDATKGDFHHPNTMTAKLLAGNESLYELEYYSVGGGFIEWKGYKPPDKGQPKYPFEHAGELKKYLIDDKIPLPQLLLANEMAISGKSEKDIWEFIDQVTEVMVRGVDTGLTVESVLPGPIKLHSKAAGMQRNLKTTAKGAAGRAITQVASYGFAMGEENARGHIIVTAPTAGSAGIIPAVVKSLRDLKTPTQQDPERLSRGGGDWLPMQAQRHPVRRRGRLSGGSRGRFFDGRCDDRTSFGCQPEGGLKCGRVRPRTSPWHDVRPGRRVRPGPLHRALRLRSSQGVDCLLHRQRRNPGGTPR